MVRILIGNSFYKKIDIQNKLISFGSLYLDTLKVINIEGDEDKVEKFLQGQVTSDVDCVSSSIMQLSSICNQKGLVMAGFILAKEGSKFKVIIASELSNVFVEELLPFAKFFGVTFKKTDEHVKVSILKNNDSFLFIKNNYFDKDVFDFDDE